jgi:hypothetical protein
MKLKIECEGSGACILGSAVLFIYILLYYATSRKVAGSISSEVI